MNRLRWLLIALLAAMLIALSACDAPVPSTPLPDIDGGIDVPKLNGQLAMFTLIRQALALYPDRERVKNIPIDADLPQICDRPVIISIHHQNSPPIWGVGKQGCIHEAILRAVYQIVQDPNFQKYYLTNLDKVAVRVEIMFSRRRLDFGKNKLSRILVEPGIHGLILQNGEQLTFQPGFNYLYHGWEPEERSKGMNAARLKQQLEYLAEAADVGDWRDYPIYRYRTISILQHRPDFFPLPILRDSPLIRKFGSREIGRAAVDAGRYLNKSFSKTNQRFWYQYNPIVREKSSFFDYSTVRHANTVYSLVTLYKASRKDEFYEVSQRSMDWLMRHTEPPLLEPELLCVKQYGLAQLGSSALTLLALCELPKTMLDKIGIQRINQLARFIVEMQESDGRFYSSYWQRLIGYMPKRQAEYFSGESLLALVRYYQINPNIEWLHAARTAAEQQIEQFKKSGAVNFWTIQGLAELYQIDPEPLYADNCFAMADDLLKHQWGNPLKNKKVYYADYQGGFDNTRPPRTLPAAVRLEALLAAYRLAYQMERDYTKYGDAIMSATFFLLQNQYRRDNSYYLRVPEEARGAFRAGLIDPRVRMDYCAHAISALTGVYDVAYMRETGTVPEEFDAEGTKALQNDLTAADQISEQSSDDKQKK